MAPIVSSSVTLARRPLDPNRGSDCGRTVLWLQGEHDGSTAAAVSAAMGNAIRRDTADLVVDLSGVQYLGAATLGVIIRAGNFLQARSRSLALRSPSPSALRVLLWCYLTDHLVDPGAVAGPADVGAHLWVYPPPAVAVGTAIST